MSFMLRINTERKKKLQKALSHHKKVHRSQTQTVNFFTAQCHVKSKTLQQSQIIQMLTANKRNSLSPNWHGIPNTHYTLECNAIITNQRMQRCQHQLTGNPASESYQSVLSLYVCSSYHVLKICTSCTVTIKSMMIRQKIV